MKLRYEKNSALLDIAARIAHDIRSPIAVMEIGLNQIEKSNFKKEIIILRMAVQRIRDIANNLLDQYRDKSAGQLVSIKALIEEAVLLKRYEWLEKNCELILSCHAISDLDRVVGEETEIKRMISNLLSNAIEACDRRAVIGICVEKSSDSVEINITDNGVGIPAEKIMCCLNGESSKHSGLGLGLPGARQYMEKINGELFIKSQFGVGTTIKLQFRQACF